MNNLVVHISDSSQQCQEITARLNKFSKEVGILRPKQVAYTIFPHQLYRRYQCSEKLFQAYNKNRGLYDRLTKKRKGWGTYFRRMTAYTAANGKVNQLENIINAIKGRKRLSKAAYTIIIQKPGSETTRPRGGPCLNYLGLQLSRNTAGDPVRVGMLAIYRNHDFLERAYGNYWGLCNLICFLARETGGIPGALTCISSRAYIPREVLNLRLLAEKLG